VTTLIMPVLAPILLQVLLLDALMGRVLLSSAKGAERARYRRIMIVNLVFSAALVIWWLPYFSSCSPASASTGHPPAGRERLVRGERLFASKL